MIDFMAHVPPELRAKYKTLSGEELRAAFRTDLDADNQEAILSELYRRRREERSKIPIEERRRFAKERFVLRKEDITIIDPGE